MTVLLTRKAVVQAQIEATYDVAESVGDSDGFLVSNPLFTVKPNVLERNFVREDLSPMPIIIGRKLASMEFETELRGNGSQNSGNPANAALINRLFRACGYLQTGFAAPSTRGVYLVGDDPVGTEWAVSSGAKATGTFTLSTASPADGDTVTIGVKTYTFKTAYTNTDGDVLIGGSFTQAALNLIAAINLAAGAGTTYAAAMTANTQVSAVTGGAGVVDVTALQAGVAGNSIATTRVFVTGADATWGAGALATGSNIASNTDMIAYYLEVTTGGASGVAQITVTSDTVGEGDAAAVVTSGTPFSIGTKGLTVTPSWTGNLVAETMWVIWLRPPGLALDPISDNFESLTIVMHKDGVKHTMPGAFGTFDVTAQAGNFATVKWVFTGTYDSPVDDPNPTPLFETTLPSQVQLARLNINNFDAVVEKFTFNQMNKIEIRPDVSSSDGYIGTRITDRKPEGGIDPEADLVANNDFWGEMAVAQRMPFQMRVGTLAGNTVWFLAPNTQYTGLTYTDRNGILAYNAGLRFSRSLGNDECEFFMC